MILLLLNQLTSYASQTQMRHQDAPMRHYVTETPMRHHVTETPMRHHVTEKPKRHHVTETPMRHHVTETPMRHHVTETPMRYHVIETPSCLRRHRHTGRRRTLQCRLLSTTIQKATKIGKTCIITGSPYKTALEAKGKLVTCPQQSSISSKKRGLPKADKTSKKNNTKKEGSGTAPCPYCSELYSNSWEQCGECGQWAHRESAGYECGGFTCEICVDD